MTRRRHDDFTTTVDAAAAHADLHHSYPPDPPDPVTPADVAPMGPPPTCHDCGGMVVFSVRPGVWSECRDCGRPHRTRDMVETVGGGR